MAEPATHHVQEPQEPHPKQGQSPLQGHTLHYPVNQGQPPHQGYLPQQQIGFAPTTTTIERQGQVQPPDYLATSIIVMLCCCLPLGVLALVQSLAVGSRHRAGDMDGALEASKSAKNLNQIGFGIGIFLWIISVVASIISGATAGSSDYHG